MAKVWGPVVQAAESLATEKGELIKTGARGTETLECWALWGARCGNFQDCLKDNSNSVADVWS